MDEELVLQKQYLGCKRQEQINIPSVSVSFSGKSEKIYPLPK